MVIQYSLPGITRGSHLREEDQKGVSSKLQMSVNAASLYVIICGTQGASAGINWIILKLLQSGLN